MSLQSTFHRLLQEPPPEYAFEISEAGLAHTRPIASKQVGFEPFEPQTIVVSPMRDNVLRPDLVQAKLQQIVPKDGKKRRAVLILPDYCSRIVTLDFDEFPTDVNNRMALVKFRMKKSVPFDLDTAAVSFQVQPGDKGKIQVLVAAVALEIVTHYEAPFRAAGFLPGLITTSSLASADLIRDEGASVTCKLNGRVLTVVVFRNRRIQMVRCVELPELDAEEVMNVLYPTVAYVEDELKTRPTNVLLCGFRTLGEEYQTLWETELGVPFQPLRSRWGIPGENNAGLLGYLESVTA
jgi:type IV pilus assembly protein PilM